MNTDLKLAKAKTALVLDHPFFASILLRRPLTVTDSVPTLAVDSRGTIFANPAFVETLTVPELVWGLAHECMHIMLLHAGRQGHRNPQKWNIAGDAVINDTLTASKVGHPIKNTVNMPGAQAKTTEQVYDELPDIPGEGGGGAGGDPLQGDVKADPNMSEAEAREMESKMKVEIAQAAQAARMQGKMPAHLQRLVDTILYVKTPWYDILERFMHEVAFNDYSWSRPNRRHVWDNIYLPSLASQTTMGVMVIGVDTSGSIGGAEMQMFQGHLNRILESVKPEKVYVVYCDAEVGSVDEYAPDDLPATFKNPTGGGGTDLREIFKWVDKQGIDPAACVVLTDMLTPFPQAVDFPTVWLATSDIVAPVGETVRFEE